MKYCMQYYAILYAFLTSVHNVLLTLFETKNISTEMSTLIVVQG